MSKNQSYPISYHSEVTLLLLLISLKKQESFNFVQFSSIYVVGSVVTLTIFVEIIVTPYGYGCPDFENINL